MIHSTPRPKWITVTQWAMVAAAILLSTFAAVALWAFVDANRPLPQPLSVTACTPESYDMPSPGELGPRQVDCVRWFQGRGDRWVWGDPVRVVGQVCLDAGVPVAYQVQVAWEAVESGARVLVIDVPITYDPGCQEAYDFVFQVPEQLLPGDTPSGESLGQWRIVGRATPVEVTRWGAYQWDATGTVELVAP